MTTATKTDARPACPPEVLRALRAARELLDAADAYLAAPAAPGDESAEWFRQYLAGFRLPVETLADALETEIRGDALAELREQWNAGRAGCAG